MEKYWWRWKPWSSTDVALPRAIKKPVEEPPGLAGMETPLRRHRKSLCLSLLTRLYLPGVFPQLPAFMWTGGRSLSLVTSLEGKVKGN